MQGWRWRELTNADGSMTVLYESDRKGIEPRLEVRQSRIADAGKGLFAARRFEAGERIVVYMGRVVEHLI